MIQEKINQIISNGHFDHIAPHKKRSDARIMVAMSGGVDSSVVAAILHHAGFQIIGATMRLYDSGSSTAKKEGACCAGVDIMDAKRVANQIGFPHYVLNYEKIFQEKVIDYFVNEYVEGQTPIPCVKCNEDIKFDVLIKNAKDIECDALITGHYLQKIWNNNRFELHRGEDPKKDQSYFLFATTQEQLDYVYFPLGGTEKSTTREIAEHFQLITAKKRESQDICFVQGKSYTEVVRKFVNTTPGEVVDESGKILGKHTGIINYTVGQRRGLNIALHYPLYVLGIDKEKNQVIVGPKESLYQQKIPLRDINWLDGNLHEQHLRQIQVKVRSTTPQLKAVLCIERDNIYVMLNEPHMGICPGQACVFYDGMHMLGGGWIVKEKICAIVDID